MHAAHLASLAAQNGGNAGKIGQLFLGIAVFAAVFIGILLLASLFKGHLGEKIQAAAFVGPTVVLISVGLIYPAILTIRRAFYSGKFFDLNFGTPRTEGNSSASTTSRPCGPHRACRRSSATPSSG